MLLSRNSLFFCLYFANFYIKKARYNLARTQKRSFSLFYFPCFITTICGNCHDYVPISIRAPHVNFHSKKPRQRFLGGVSVRIIFPTGNHRRFYTQIPQPFQTCGICATVVGNFKNFRTHKRTAKLLKKTQTVVRHNDIFFIKTNIRGKQVYGSEFQELRSAQMHRFSRRGRRCSTCRSGTWTALHAVS